MADTGSRGPAVAHSHADAPEGPPPGVDAPSGALNFPAFVQEYARAIASGKYRELAIWFVDIRNFRSVNPQFGFMAGNDVLRAVADGLSRELAGELPVARLGGDRFVLLTDGLDADSASERFKQAAASIDRAVKAHGIHHQTVLSAGFYKLRDIDYRTTDHHQPLDYASIAHRKAKSDPKSNLTPFTKEDLERDTRRMTIEHSVDDALADGQIQVWYQPQIDYATGKVTGAEALARWNHAELGWISPAEFIPVLERCGKVHDLDLFVWEQACKDASRWQELPGGLSVPISINVSRAEMFEPGLLEHFVELQEKYGLSKGSLHIEVTESAFVEEAERLYRVIDSLRRRDLVVEMDDFGSGLSSLNMLKDIPVDVVKLDLGFIRSTVSEDRGGVVLGSVIRMLQGLDTPIIAEGVETPEQAETLKNMGCHLMQGYLFAKPMPRASFEEFMESDIPVGTSCPQDPDAVDLEHLMSLSATSSYLFNKAMGGTMVFFAGEGTSESILVNDAFYEGCGLSRDVFGDAKVNPIEEIDEDSRAALWAAAAEAREHGAAICRAEVRITKRWIECVMRYLGYSARGDVYSLNIVRSYGSEAQGE